MAMLYLTPVLPLGLVSYMCGTTSLKLFDFAAAKIASLPLYLIYTFIGASAHSFIKRGGDNSESGGSIGASVADEAKKLEENQFLLVSGLVLSISMMTLITRYIRKELMKVGLGLRHCSPMMMLYFFAQCVDVDNMFSFCISINSHMYRCLTN